MSKYTAEIIYLDDDSAPQKKEVSYGSLDEAKTKSITEEKEYIRIKVSKSSGGTECTTVNPISITKAWIAFCKYPSYEGVLMSGWGIFPMGTEIGKVTEWFDRIYPDIWKFLATIQYTNEQKQLQRKKKKKPYVSVSGKQRVRTHDGVYRLVKMNGKFGIVHSYKKNPYEAAVQEVYCTLDSREEAEMKLAEIYKAFKAQKPRLKPTRMNSKTV